MNFTVFDLYSLFYTVSEINVSLGPKVFKFFTIKMKSLDFHFNLCLEGYKFLLPDIKMQVCCSKHITNQLNNNELLNTCYLENIRLKPQSITQEIKITRCLNALNKMLLKKPATHEKHNTVIKTNPCE